MSLHYHTCASPLGTLHLVASEEALCVLALENYWRAALRDLGELQTTATPLLECTVQQLDEYFSGERTAFDLPLQPKGTEFQQRVWHALCQIPYGETRSYAQQAEQLGNPNAVRAVGRTNGLNPIGIIVPCHRVIGKSGHLTGYAGGLEAKRFLLDLEARHAPFRLT